MKKVIATHLVTALVAIGGTSTYFLSQANTTGQADLVNCVRRNEITWDGPRVQSNPEAFGYVEAGNAKLRAGDGLGAEREYMRAVAIDPKSADLLVTLAVSQEHLKKYGEAVRSFQKALVLDPGNGYALAGLGGAEYRARNLSKAIELYTQSLDKEPHFAGAHWGIAWAYRDRGEYQKAIEHLDGYLATTPDKEHADFAREQRRKLEESLRKTNSNSNVK